MSRLLSIALKYRESHGRTVHAAARSAGRSPTAIRRAYNLGGYILSPGSQTVTPRRKGVLIGPVSRWIEELTRYYADLRMDTFILWPIGSEEAQVRLFAEEVVPAVQAAVNKA